MSRCDLTALALLASAAARAEGRLPAVALAGTAIFVVCMTTVLWGRGDDT